MREGAKKHVARVGLYYFIKPMHSGLEWRITAISQFFTDFLPKIAQKYSKGTNLMIFGKKMKKNFFQFFHRGDPLDFAGILEFEHILEQERCYE